jgi:integrase/recombinase XerD
MNGAHPFSMLLESFFLDRLMRQRQASPLTIASYRDTFRLLMQYAQQRLRKAPSQLTVPDLDTVFLGSFLDHLEQHRANSARSRNVRLAAIHSFFRYVALQAPEYSAVAQRVLAIPSKRYVRRPISFLTPVEIDALLAAPDLTTWSGRRDRALLLLTVQTGLRAAEVIGLRCEHIVPGTGAHVQCLGKGRKPDARPFVRRRSPCCAVGYESVRVSPPIRSFQPCRGRPWGTTVCHTCSTSISVSLAVIAPH